MSCRNVRWPHRMLPLMSHGEMPIAERTDRRTPDRYVMLSVRRCERNSQISKHNLFRLIVHKLGTVKPCRRCRRHRVVGWDRCVTPE